MYSQQDKAGLRPTRMRGNCLRREETAFQEKRRNTGTPWHVYLQAVSTLGGSVRLKRSWNPKLLQYVSTPFFFFFVAGNKTGDYSSLFSVCYWLELLRCIFYGTTIPLSSNMSRAPLKGNIALHQVPIIMSGCAVEVRCWNSKFLNRFYFAVVSLLLWRVNRRC